MNFVFRRNIVKAPLEGALDHKKKHPSPAVLHLIGRVCGKFDRIQQERCIKSNYLCTRSTRLETDTPKPPLTFTPNPIFPRGGGIFKNKLTKVFCHSCFRSYSCELKRTKHPENKTDGVGQRFGRKDSWSFVVCVFKQFSSIFEASLASPFPAGRDAERAFKNRGFLCDSQH